MLALILAHGNVVRLIQQNVRRHECGICEKTAVYVVGVLGALVLKLRHAGKLAEHRVAVEYPAQLCVLVNVALHEKGVLLRVDAAGDVLRKLLKGAAAKLRRVLTHGERVQIGHKVVAVKFVGSRSPVLDRTEVVAEMQVAGGLNARKHYLLSDFVFHGFDSLYLPIT